MRLRSAALIVATPIHRRPVQLCFPVVQCCWRYIVMITRRCFALAAASALASGITAKRANALAWPTHPVRIVVPFAAGGPTDVIARIVGERLSKSWDQQVLIENRPGGGTNIANELVARSDPDGHTVLLGGSSQAATRGLYPSLSYDPIGDFAPVAFLCSYSFFMFVPNSLPVKSVSEFIAYGKANKGKLTLASPGTGSSPHLCGELFKHMAGLDMIHVPYRGAAPAMNDLIPGRVISCSLAAPRSITPDLGRSRCSAIRVPNVPRSRPTCRRLPRAAFQVSMSCHGTASLCRPGLRPRSSRK